MINCRPFELGFSWYVNTTQMSICLGSNAVITNVTPLKPKFYTPNDSDINVEWNTSTEMPFLCHFAGIHSTGFWLVHTRTTESLRGFKKRSFPIAAGTVYGVDTTRFPSSYVLRPHCDAGSRIQWRHRSTPGGSFGWLFRVARVIMMCLCLYHGWLLYWPNRLHDYFVRVNGGSVKWVSILCYWVGASVV